MSIVTPLTPLQFKIVEFLIKRQAQGPVSGRDLREELGRLGDKKSAPAFYQLMARMEDAGWVDGDYRHFEDDGYQLRERVYTLKGNGVNAYNATREFYLGAADGTLVGRGAMAGGGA